MERIGLDEYSAKIALRLVLNTSKSFRVLYVTKLTAVSVTFYLFVILHLDRDSVAFFSLITLAMDSSGYNNLQ